MSMFTVTDASQTFQVSDEAAAKVKALIEAEDESEGLVLRVAVRPGGCSGFSYEMFFDTDVAEDDFQAEHRGIKVVIDPASQQMLKGACSNSRTVSRAPGSRSATRTLSAVAAADSRSRNRPFDSNRPQPRICGAVSRLGYCKFAGVSVTLTVLRTRCCNEARRVG